MSCPSLLPWFCHRNTCMQCALALRNLGFSGIWQRVIGWFWNQSPSVARQHPRKTQAATIPLWKIKKNRMMAYKLCSYPLFILLKPSATSCCSGSHTLINTHSQHVQIWVFSCHKSSFSSRTKYHEIVKDVSGRTPKRLSGFRSLFV